jgi:REP element-mobilizing transposase RayT
MENTNKSSSHAVFNIKLHIVLVLINNLKTARARRTRNRFAEHLAPFYLKPLFWHRAYFVGSVGGATLETFVLTCMLRVRKNMHARPKQSQIPNRPLDPLLAQGWRGSRQRWGMRGQMFNSR